MTPAISIGCQLGGPERCILGDLKVALYQSLERHVTSTHCDAIDKYAIVLRIDGSLDKFGEEGLARLRFAKARRYITIDIQVPKNVWQPMNEVETKRYLARQINSAIATCVSRLKKDKLHVNEQILFKQIDEAVREFLSQA